MERRGVVGDSVPVGSRAADGDWISFREAVRMFATKEELEKTDRLLNDSVQRMNEMPTRAELNERWRREDERYEGLTIKVGEVDLKLTAVGESLTKYRMEAQGGRIPVWFLGVMGVAMPLIVVAILHFWK